MRAWVGEAVRRIAAARPAEPPLRPFPLPAGRSVRLRFLDESVHPTGSLKYRHARALFLYALSSGLMEPGCPVVDAGGGNMAVASAYFARMIGIPFTAVVPEKTPTAQTARITAMGGSVVRVDPPIAIYAEARSLASRLGGHYLDHLAHVERAADRLRDSVADDILRRTDPAWIVVGAGTGATSAVIGRRLRAHGGVTGLLVVDPENSAYQPGWETGAADYATGMPSRISGIGRPRMEPGFVPSVVDLVMTVPDAASIAAMQLFRDVTGTPVGPSTGANLWGALRLAAQMRAHGQSGEIVSLVNDRRPAVPSGLDPAPHRALLTTFLATGRWPRGA